MRQKGFALVMVVVILTIIGIVSYFVYNNYSSQISKVSSTKSPIPTTTTDGVTNTTKEEWKYFDNQCFSIKYPYEWSYGLDKNTNNLPETGINWVNIFYGTNNKNEIARMTLVTDGTKFSFLKYRQENFSNIKPKVINIKNIYYFNDKYLIGTNCPTYYLLIDILDKNSSSIIGEIVNSLQ